MTVGVDKISDLAWLIETVGTLNCESPHVTHIPHLRPLIGFGLVEHHEEIHSIVLL